MAGTAALAAGRTAWKHRACSYEQVFVFNAFALCLLFFFLLVAEVASVPARAEFLQLGPRFGHLSTPRCLLVHPEQPHS